MDRNVRRSLPDESDEPTLEQPLPAHGLPECCTLSSVLISCATWGTVQNDAGGNALPVRNQTEELDVGIDVEHKGILADGMVLPTLLGKDSAQLSVLKGYFDEIMVHCLNGLA